MIARGYQVMAQDNGQFCIVKTTIAFNMTGSGGTPIFIAVKINLDNFELASRMAKAFVNGTMDDKR